MIYLVAILAVVFVLFLWHKLKKNQERTTKTPDVGLKVPEVETEPRKTIEDYIGPIQKGPESRIEQLRRQYARRAKLPSHRVDGVIDQLISKHRQKNPGHSDEWYLEKMLYDLERDYK